MLGLGTCGPGWDVGTGNFIGLAGIMRLMEQQQRLFMLQQETQRQAVAKQQVAPAATPYPETYGAATGGDALSPR